MLILVLIGLSLVVGYFVLMLTISEVYGPCGFFLSLFKGLICTVRLLLKKCPHSYGGDEFHDRWRRGSVFFLCVLSYQD